jgi:hypothetical protein
MSENKNFLAVLLTPNVLKVHTKGIINNSKVLLSLSQTQPFGTAKAMAVIGALFYNSLTDPKFKNDFREMRDEAQKIYNLANKILDAERTQQNMASVAVPKQIQDLSERLARQIEAAEEAKKKLVDARNKEVSLEKKIADLGDTNKMALQQIETEKNAIVVLRKMLEEAKKKLEVKSDEADEIERKRRENIAKEKELQAKFAEAEKKALEAKESIMKNIEFAEAEKYRGLTSSLKALTNSSINKLNDTAVIIDTVLRVSYMAEMTSADADYAALSKALSEIRGRKKTPSEPERQGFISKLEELLAGINIATREDLDKAKSSFATLSQEFEKVDHKAVDNIIKILYAVERKLKELRNEDFSTTPDNSQTSPDNSQPSSEEPVFSPGPPEVIPEEKDKDKDTESDESEGGKAEETPVVVPPFSTSVKSSVIGPEMEKIYFGDYGIKTVDRVMAAISSAKREIEFKDIKTSNIFVSFVEQQEPEEGPVLLKSVDVDSFFLNAKYIVDYLALYYTKLTPTKNNQNPAVLRLDYQMSYMGFVGAFYKTFLVNLAYSEVEDVLKQEKICQFNPKLADVATVISNFFKGVADHAFKKLNPVEAKGVAYQRSFKRYKYIHDNLTKMEKEIAKWKKKVEAIIAMGSDKREMLEKSDVYYMIMWMQRVHIVFDVLVLEFLQLFYRATKLDSRKFGYECYLRTISNWFYLFSPIGFLMESVTEETAHVLGELSPKNKVFIDPSLYGVGTTIGVGKISKKDLEDPEKGEFDLISPVREATGFKLNDEAKAELKKNPSMVYYISPLAFEEKTPAPITIETFFTKMVKARADFAGLDKDFITAPSTDGLDYLRSEEPILDTDDL